MKVRARVKAFELLPEWAKCCTPMILSYQFGEREIVSCQPRGAGKAECLACHSLLPEGIDAKDSEGLLIPLEVLDLDEGPMEAA